MQWINKNQILSITKKIILICLSLIVLLIWISIIKINIASWLNMEYFQTFLTNPFKTIVMSYFLTEITMSGSPIAWVLVSVWEYIGMSKMTVAAWIVGTRLWVNLLLFILWFIYFLKGKPLKQTMDIWVLQFLISFTISIASIFFLILFLESEYLSLFSQYVIANTNLLNSVWFLWFIDTFSLYISSIFNNSIVNIIVWFILLSIWLVLFDKSFSFVDSKKSLKHLKTINSDIWAFLAGFLITSFSMSLSISVTILIPLYIKWAVNKRQLIAYIIWANITTLLDTLMLSVIANSAIWFNVVLAFCISVAIVWFLYMLWFKHYSKFILYMEDQILENKINFIIFLIITLILPIFILFV